MRTKAERAFYARLDELAAGRMILQMGDDSAVTAVGLAHLAFASEAVVTTRDARADAFERAKNAGVENFGCVIAKDMTQTTLSGSNYDLIHWRDLYHRARFPYLLNEARRLLQPGGRLLILESDKRAIHDAAMTFEVISVTRFGWLKRSAVIELRKETR